MKTRIIAAIMAVSLLAGTSAFAQNQRGMRSEKSRTEMRERPTAEQMAQRMTDRMTQNLNLDDKQAKEIYEMNLKSIKQGQERREKAVAERKNLRDERTAKMKKILTNEQFDRWQKMTSERGKMQRGGKKGCHMKGESNMNRGAKCCKR